MVLARWRVDGGGFNSAVGVVVTGKVDGGRWRFNSAVAVFITGKVDGGGGGEQRRQHRRANKVEVAVAVARRRRDLCYGKVRRWHQGRRKHGFGSLTDGRGQVFLEL